jgi:hypothetical protein
VPLSVTPLSISQFYPSPPPDSINVFKERGIELPSPQQSPGKSQSLGASLWHSICSAVPFKGAGGAKSYEDTDIACAHAKISTSRVPNVLTREPVPSSHKTPTALPPLEVQPSAVVTTLPSSAPSPVTDSCHSVVSPVCQSTCQRNAPSQLGYEGNQG